MSSSTVYAPEGSAHGDKSPWADPGPDLCVARAQLLVPVPAELWLYDGAMATSRASMSYATALNRNELFSSPGLRRDVPKALDPQEEVLLALPGVAGDYPDVMIATVRRLLVAKVTGGFTGVKVKKEARADQITGIAYRPGIFSRVKIQVEGARDIAMMPNRKADAERFAQAFEHLLRTGHLPD